MSNSFKMLALCSFCWLLAFGFSACHAQELEESSKNTTSAIDLSEINSNLTIQKVIFPRPNEFRFEHYVFEGPKQLSNALGCLFPKGTHKDFVDEVLINNAEASEHISQENGLEKDTKYKYEKQAIIRSKTRTISFEVFAKYKNEYLYEMKVQDEPIVCQGAGEQKNQFDGL